MQNFVFHNPTKVLFGNDTVSQIGSETCALGRRGLLVHGRGSARESGLYQQVRDLLDAAGVSIVDHGGVTSNPLLSHVREGVDKVRAEHIDVVIGMGGGSVIDTAKAICAGGTVAHDVWKFFTGKKSIRRVLPLTTVLTLSGAGSEMNSGMVLTNDATREKFGFGHRLLFPRTSILDPELTYTVPPDYTAYGAVDAIAHIIEFYMTTTDPDTPVQDRLMEGLIINAMESCLRCLDDPEDYNGRANLMWTATLALNGLTAAGLGRVGFPMHLIEHSLSGLYEIPHGAGMAVILPGWLKWTAIRNPQRIARLMQRIFPENIVPTMHQDTMAACGIELLTGWFRRIGAPTSLQELNIPQSSIEHISTHTRGLARVWRLKQYTPETVATILEMCL